MTQQSGGPLYPGVTSDGLTPPGIIVQGSVLVEGAITTDVRLRANVTDLGDGGSDAVVGVQRGALGADNQAAALTGHRVGATNGHAYTEAVIYAEDDTDSPPSALLYQGYSSLGSVFKVNNAGGVGRFGHAAPETASTVSGALSSVTDPAAKAVLTSIIAALMADGGATDGTT